MIQRSISAGLRMKLKNSNCTTAKAQWDDSLGCIRSIMMTTVKGQPFLVNPDCSSTLRPITDKSKDRSQVQVGS